LDVPSPPGQTEILRQLFLRNSFATELFSPGSAEAVLGVGLGDYESQRAQSEELIWMLTRGENVGEIARRLRQLALEFSSLTGLLGSVGITLHAIDPSFAPCDRFLDLSREQELSQPHQESQS
jgi:hypothetical protein